MILVTAATGHLGRLIIEFLMKKVQPGQFMAMAKDLTKAEDLHSKKIEILKGDYNDYPSLVKNFKNIDKLLFISSGSLENRIQQHKNVVDAARETGVKHIYYTSYVNTIPDAIFSITKDHFETENYIKNSGLTYTIFRNATYMDELPGLIGEAVKTGKIYYPAGNGKVSFVTRRDLAEAIVNAITGDGYENQVLDLDASTGYSFNDAAKALSEATGKNIEFVDIPLETLQQNLKEKKLPKFAIDLLTQMAEAIKNNEWNYPGPTLTNILGREPESLKSFFRRTIVS